MAGLHEGHSSELAIFQTPAVETGIENVEWIDYRPVSQLSGGGAIDFSLANNSASYIDLKRTRLHIKARIVKADGTSVSQEDDVALINLPLQSMWSQIDLSLQQQVVSPSIGNNYSYKSLIDVLLNNEEDPKMTQLQSQLYFMDTHGHMDDSSVTAGQNNGLLKRWEYTSGGKVLDLEGPLYLDICDQDRFILNGVQISIKLWPNKDSFRLMAADAKSTYSLKVTDALLKVATVRVSPGVLIGHGEALKRTPAIYPYTRSDIRTFAIPKGLYSVSVDDIFQGTVPSSIILGLVASEAYSGSLTRNPFNFGHYNCSFVGLYVNGQAVPSHPIQPNFKEGTYVDAYLSLFTATGKYGQNAGNYISREQFDQGYSLIVLDIDGGRGQTNHSYAKTGHVRLELKFGEALPEGVTLILYGKFPAMLQIDETRNVRL